MGYVRTGQKHHFTVFRRAQGQISVLEIHKEAVIKALKFFEHVGSDDEEAAGAEVDLGGLSENLVLSCVFCGQFF